MIRTMAMAAALLCAGTAQAQLSVIDGPVDARILRVIDSDTYEFVAYPFPEIAVWGQVRVDGIDSPEKNAKCQYEKDLSAKATTYVLNLFAANKNNVKMYVIGLKGSDGGAFGRYRAQLRVDGQSLSEMMIKEGLAREYHGGKRRSWC